MNDAPGWLDKRRTIAGPAYDRWLVPPAALCIHLCIGMAYGFSVFWLPLTRAVGITQPVRCPAGTSWADVLTTTTCDWDKPLLGWTYTLFFVFLGGSAAIFGPWLERVGPRKAGVYAAFAWGGGFFVSALGVRLHLRQFGHGGSLVVGALADGVEHAVEGLEHWHAVHQVLLVASEQDAALDERLLRVDGARRHADGGVPGLFHPHIFGVCGAGAERCPATTHLQVVRDGALGAIGDHLRDTDGVLVSKLL